MKRLAPSVFGALLALGLLSSPTSAAPQGPWVLPATSLSAAGQDAETPVVTTCPDGSTIVVWIRNDGNHNTVQAAIRPPGGGAFGTPIDLSTPGQNASDPDVATGADGTTTAVWQRYNGANTIVQAATRPAGGTFGTPVDLSTPGQDAGYPDVAIAPDGTTTAIWRRYNGSNTIVQAATRPAGGTFDTPVDLSTPGQNAFQPQITTGPDGTTTAVWRRFDGANTIVQAATRPAGGAFGTPVDLSTPGQDTGSPLVTTGSDGTTTAVWFRSDGSNTIVQAATRVPGGAFGTPVDLSTPGESAYEPAVATGPDGTTTAVWDRYDGSNTIVQAVSTAQPVFPLQVVRTGSGAGTVTSTPSGIDCGTSCSAEYPSFTKVTLNATSTSGSTFTGWSGEGCSGSSTCQVTMQQARSVTAEFTADDIPVVTPPAGQPKLAT